MTFDPRLSEEATRNMDADRELLADADAGQWGWRLYEWEAPAVTLGMSQNPDRDLLPDCPIGYAVRPTGGRAVLHGHDLTLGLAIPLSVLGLPAGSRSLKAAYRPAAQWIIAGLNHCGVDCALGEDLPGSQVGGRSADCFAHVAQNDIVSLETQNKVCGCALRMTETAILLQASIPVKAPLVDPASVFRHPATLPPISISRADLEAVLNLKAPF